MRLPLFDGGRRDARRAESASQYRQEKVRSNDLKEQIELDVRLALDELKSAEDEVKVAREGLELANNELTQARRRYQAGVANSLEVTDAQTRLERALDNQTGALYAYNVARLDLAQATGKVRSFVQ
jgi:outer membrane protein TolC